MKKKKTKKRRSLYLYISIAFLIILSVVVLVTTIYFGFFHKHVIGIDENEVVAFKDFFKDIDVNQILSGLKSAITYGVFTGIAMILVAARRIIKPIRELTEATKKVADGDFKVNVATKRNDEIRELADNFNIMVKELNSIGYLRKDFVSNISHEFKTPIASIQGFTKLLAQDNLSKEERQEYANIILEESNRLSNLSSNMLKISKFENQEIITNKKEYRLDEQIRKAIIMLEEKINSKNIKVTLNSEPIIINQDSDLIMEIWINLLNNAVKYSKQNGKIDINIKEQQEFVKIQIKDDGIGIPEDKQNRVFEKFYQVESSHSAEGSGLGLAIVKRIIDLIEGTIELDSEEGEGTLFTIRIPKATGITIV